MQLNTLQPAPGSIKKKKRIARGQGSGRGGTATKGHKGAQSRSGYKRKIGFEGGQLPLQRRLPRFGFKNPNRKIYKIINIETLQHLYETKNITVFDKEVFHKYGLASKKAKIKILGNGTLQVALNISAHAFSEKAKTCIEEMKGKIILL